MRISGRIRPRRALGLALVAIGASGFGIASAAQLQVDGQQVVAGVGAATECDADGVSVVLAPVYTPDAPAAGFHLTQLVLGDLNDPGSTCGGTISVIITDSSGNALATGSIGFPAAPTTEVAITLSTPVAASAVTGVAVAIG